MKGVIMARKAAAPSYLHHKASGQAYTRINGEMVYLGEFNSRESREKWAEIVSDWSAGNLDKYGESVSISRLCVAYVKHSERYYRKGGKQTSEVCRVRCSMRCDAFNAQLPACVQRCLSVFVCI